ncbi:MAG TPA: FAD/NAD(P)-binding oxidoreductase [Fimbriimonadales bacterium]|nr:FAD/NAD(P)-binding oxidoreductase [Fimbriimonadales bacterium]
MASKTLILGGGFGGLVTATTLRNLLPSDHEIILLEKSQTFTMGTTKTWLMLGKQTRKQIEHPRRGLEKRGVRLHLAQIQKIDAEKREVDTDKGKFAADYLVIALGADYDMNRIPGLAQASEEFYSVNGAERLNSVVKDFSEGELVLLIPAIPFKCPPAPYEGVFLLHDYFVRNNKRVRMNISVYTVEGAPMATAGPEIGNFIKSELAKRNIAYHTQKKTLRVDPDTKKIVFEDGEVKYDLLITIPPHKAPDAVKESGLLDQRGWIPADPKTLRMKDLNKAFAIGDVAVVPLPGRFKSDMPLVLPKAGVFAESEGKVVATQIASEILGKEPSEFDGKGFCYVEMGDMHAFRGDGSFFDLPHPTMKPKVPDMTQYQEKIKWVEDWVKKYVE